MLSATITKDMFVIMLYSLGLFIILVSVLSIFAMLSSIHASMIIVEKFLKEAEEKRKLEDAENKESTDAQRRAP